MTTRSSLGDRVLRRVREVLGLRLSRLVRRPSQGRPAEDWEVLEQAGPARHVVITLTVPAERVVQLPDMPAPRSGQAPVGRPSDLQVS